MLPLPLSSFLLLHVTLPLSILCQLKIEAKGFSEMFVLIIHNENPTRCNSVSKFYFIFISSSTGFGRYTAHHQEPKTALAASDFAYVEGCWTRSWWTLTASSNYTSNNIYLKFLFVPQIKHITSPI
jgi:hypothetical protein